MRANSLTAALSIVAMAAVGASTAGCNRSDKNSTPVAQMQTQTPAQPVNQRTTVVGCLRAGESADTYVLTASQAQDGSTPATYALFAGEDVDLRGNVGQQVQVTGVVTTQEAVSTITPSTAPANKPEGTSGSKPQVQTQTQLEMRRFDVTSINKVADRCDTK
jgi:hypothetical protein